MQVVDDLEVGLIPREQFAKRQWFSASPLWYYHRVGRPMARRMSREFYSLIDEHLRDVCLMLHGAGLSTLPSCEGHFHDAKYFAGVWEHLQREQDAIRVEGLPVRDSEAEIDVLFRSDAYQLPWASFADFYSDLTATQPGGYLGIGLGPDFRHVARELNRYPYRETGASITLERPRPGFWIAAAYVDPQSPEDVQRLWRNVTSHLKRLTHMPVRRLAADVAGMPIYRPA